MMQTFAEWVYQFMGNPKLCKKHAAEFRQCLRVCDIRIVGGFGAHTSLTQEQFLAAYIHVRDNPTEWAGLRELFNFK